MKKAFYLTENFKLSFSYHVKLLMSTLLSGGFPYLNWHGPVLLEFSKEICKVLFSGFFELDMQFNLLKKKIPLKKETLPSFV